MLLEGGGVPIYAAVYTLCRGFRGFQGECLPQHGHLPHNIQNAQHLDCEASKARVTKPMSRAKFCGLVQ